uniref:RNA-dependent RNA polymerase n=1 Tax=Promirotermes bunya-like virus 1 TaxID=3133473 RepID=A0AAT9JN48_9VIRU
MEYRDNLIRASAKAHGVMVKLQELRASPTISGSTLYTLLDEAEHLRHEAVVIVCASRLNVTCQEMPISHTLEPDLNVSKSSFMINHDYNKTPDLVKKETGWTVKGVPYINYTFYEIAVTNVYREKKEEKLLKYREILNRAENVLKNDNPGSSVSIKLKLIIITSDLKNWDVQLNTLNVGCKDDILEKECHALCRYCDNCSRSIHETSYFLTQDEQERFHRLRLEKRFDVVIPDILDGLNIDFNQMNQDLDTLDGVMPRYEETFRMGEKEILDGYLECISKHWQSYSTKLKEPSRQAIKEAQLDVQNELENNFGKRSFEKRSPCFHFIYKLKTKSSPLKGFQQRFMRAENIIRQMKDSGKAAAEFLQGVFCSRNMSKEDRLVFFNEGAVDDWDNVKKELRFVKQPKVLKTKVLNKNAKEVLKEAGVKGKKKCTANNIKERIEEKIAYAKKRSEMDCLQWWDEATMNECLADIELKSNFFMNRSLTNIPTHISPDNTTDPELWKHVEYWECTAAAEYAKHIKIMAKNMVYRNNNSGRGLNIVNSGNDDIWLITLPGEDITHAEGDVRFIQVAILNRVEFECMKTVLFCSELVKEVFECGDYYVVMTRWLSLNKARWEHLEKAEPISLTVLMSIRANIDHRLLKYLNFAYMYCALGCNSKTSGLIDNFRYILPAAMAHRSGITDYIKDKMKIVTKNSGQCWLMKVLMDLCCTYAHERLQLVQKELKYVDDEMVAETGGVHGHLSSAFIKGFRWMNRDLALGEIYVAFHLTGKGFHDSHHRDLEFIKTVVGNEVEFNETFKAIPEAYKIFGLPMKESATVLNSKRGGLFCKEAVQLSGHIVSLPCLFNKEKFMNYVRKEGLKESILSNPLLSSTKSSIKSCGWLNQEYKIETQTLLETTMDQVYDTCREEAFAALEVMHEHGELFEQSVCEVMGLKEDEDEEGAAFRPAPKSSQGSLASNESSESSTEIRNKSRRKFQRESFRSMSEHLKAEEEKFVSRMSKIPAPNIKDKLQKRQASLGPVGQPEEVNVLSGGLTVVLKDKKVLLSGQNLDKSLELYEDKLTSLGKPTLYETAAILNGRTLKRNKYCPTPIRADSPLFLCLKNLCVRPVFKIVAKGQRTYKDREIFVQNRARYSVYVEEHIAKGICKMIPNECITSPGDEKMVKLKKLFDEAQIWKARVLEVNGVRMVKHVRFITGDMSKFSNHSNSYILRMFLSGMLGNIPDNVYNLLMTLIRTECRKTVLPPANIIRKMTQWERENEVFDKLLASMDASEKMDAAAKWKDSTAEIKEMFKRTDSNFPEARLKQNWLQGMRNFLASAANCGAAITIKKLFHKINPAELTFDFLAHSDDWVCYYGYCTPLTKFESDKKYNTAWREKYSVKSSKEIEDFLLATILMVYKLNNLTVSIKKSSVSDKFAEFVSYTVNGGSCYMGGEKQVLAIFSETPGTGPKEDVLSVLSQSSGAVMKGISSTYVDYCIEVSLNNLRNDYGFNDGQRFDPCLRFGLPRQLLPLCFIPKLSHSSLDAAFSTVHCHDINLIGKISKHLENDTEPKEELIRAGKLLYSCSTFNLGRSSDETILSELGKEGDLVPGFIIKSKGVTDKAEKVALNKLSCERDLKLLKYVDFTQCIMKPRDFLFSLGACHSKLLDDDFLQSIMKKGKVTQLRSRGDFRNKETVKFRCEDQYSTLNQLLSRLQAWCELTKDSDLRRGFRSLDMVSTCSLSSNMVMLDWLNTLKVEKSNIRLPEVKMIIKLPHITRANETVNPIRTLLVNTLNNERFQLNGMKFDYSRNLADDELQMQSLLFKSNYYESVGLTQRIKTIQLISRFVSGSDKRQMILSSSRRSTPSVEKNLTWIKLNNTFLKTRGFLTQGSNLMDLDLVLNPARKSRLAYQQEISQLSFLTKIIIVQDKDLIEIRTVLNESLREHVEVLVESCHSRNIGLSTKSRLMLSHLEYFHTGKERVATSLYVKELVLTYVHQEEDWNKKQKYKNALLKITKGIVQMNIEFTDGYMDITFDMRHNGLLFPEFMRFLYNKHKFSCSIDKYTIFDSFEQTEHVSSRNLYVMGREGVYNICSVTDTDFNHDYIIAQFHDSPMVSEIDLISNIALDESKFRLMIKNTMVGSIAYETSHHGQLPYTFEMNDQRTHIDLNVVNSNGHLTDALNSEISYIKDPISYMLKATPDELDLDPLYAVICQLAKLGDGEEVYTLEYNEQLEKSQKAKKEKFQEAMKTKIRTFPAPKSEYVEDITWSSSSSSEVTSASTSSSGETSGSSKRGRRPWSEMIEEESETEPEGARAAISEESPEWEDSDSDAEATAELQYTDPRGRNDYLYPKGNFDNWLHSSHCMQDLLSIDYSWVLYAVSISFQNKKEEEYWKLKKKEPDFKKVQRGRYLSSLFTSLMLHQHYLSVEEELIQSLRSKQMAVLQGRMDIPDWVSTIIECININLK